ncbi:MAG: hypothetical protein E7630_01390 [Ruminococcaceae bacterium]|nr:hypothetical protein [Oscillospiraceae bacterium]
MKTRKFFALLLSAVLLMALAVVPASAENEPNYTLTHTFAAAGDLGNLAPEGGVTVEGNAAKIAAGKYMLKEFTANTYNAMELKMTVTAGSVTIRMGKTSSASFQVKFTANDYTIYTENPAAGAFQRTVKKASYTGSIVFSYMIDKTTNRAIFTVNGDETVLAAVVTESSATPLVNAGPLDISFTNWAGFGIFADGSANASVSSIKLGTVSFTNGGGGNEDDNDDNVSYTLTHTFAAAGDLGNLAPEGGVTVEGNAAKIAAGKYMLKEFTANTYNATELKMTVTAGSVTIRMGKTSSASFQVKFTANDYTIYTENPAAGAFQRTVKNASYTGSIVFSYMIDKINNKAIFTVNGEETVLDAVVTESTAAPLVNAGSLDISFTNWAGFGIFADGSANASVSSIKLGTATFTSNNGGGNTGNGGNGSAPNTGDGLFAVVASIAVLAGAVVLTKRKKSV